MFSSDSYVCLRCIEELTKKRNVCQTAIIFHFCEHCSFGLGKLFEWFSFQNFSMVLFMEVLIIAVYAVVNIICYLSDRADAQSMNEKLLEMKKNKKE